MEDTKIEIKCDHDRIVELEVGSNIKFDNIDQKLLSICSSLVIIEGKIDKFYNELCKRPTWGVLLPLVCIMLGISTAIFSFITYCVNS